MCSGTPCFTQSLVMGAVIDLEHFRLWLSIRRLNVPDYELLTRVPAGTKVCLVLSLLFMQPDTVTLLHSYSVVSPCLPRDLR
jgi:hypothetical protein